MGNRKKSRSAQRSDVRVEMRMSKKERKRLEREQLIQTLQEAGALATTNKGKKGKRMHNTSYYDNKDPVTVIVMEGDKELFRSTYVPIVVEYADALTQVYPWSFDEKTKELTLSIPRERYKSIRAVGSYQPKRPLLCGYHATRDYLESLHGVRLSNTDDQLFYETHPLVVAEGLPAAHTLRVIHDLIEPYGMRIARVRMAPGTSMPKGLMDWQTILGCNPLALGDRTTTNAEFAEMVGLSLEECNNQFRFEFGEEGLRPAITCASASGNVGTVSGYTGGHASYRGPRSKLIAADLSIQLSRVVFDPWPEGPPVFEALEPAAVPEVPMIPDMFKMWDDLPYDSRKGLQQPFTGNFSHRKGTRTTALPPRTPSLPPSGTGTTLKPTSPPSDMTDGWMNKQESGTINSAEFTRRREPDGKHCCACGEKKDTRFKVSGPFCLDCWTCLFVDMVCAATNKTTGEPCRTAFVDSIPDYRGFDWQKSRLLFRCLNCGTDFYLTPQKGEQSFKVNSYEKLILTALQYNLYPQEREKLIEIREHRSQLILEAWDGLDEAEKEALLRKNAPENKQPESTGVGPSATIH